MMLTFHAIGFRCGHGGYTFPPILCPSCPTPHSDGMLRQIERSVVSAWVDHICWHMHTFLTATQWYRYPEYSMAQFIPTSVEESSIMNAGICVRFANTPVAFFHFRLSIMKMSKYDNLPYVIYSIQTEYTFLHLFSFVHIWVGGDNQQYPAASYTCIMQKFH